MAGRFINSISFFLVFSLTISLVILVLLAGWALSNLKLEELDPIFRSAIRMFGGKDGK